MGDIVDKLTYLQETKAQIMKVLQDKNVNVLNETAFREYVSLMLNGLQGIRRTSYKRPTDWLAMPAIGTTEEKVECLIPVYSDNAMNYAPVTATGNYSRRTSLYSTVSPMPLG